MALGQRGDGRDQLRQRGAQRHKGERDHRLRHAQCLRDQGAVIHQQVRAHGNEHRAHGQQTQLLGKGSIFVGLLRFFRGRGVLHRHHVADDVGREHGQKHKAHRAGEVAGGVGHTCIEGRCHKEKQHRRAQALGVYLARLHRNGDGRNEGCITDDRTDGVAIGDLAVAGEGRGGGDHDLRQGGANGHHGGTDEQLRHMEAAGNARGTIHEPVAALDEAQQAHDEQQNRNEHSFSPFVFGRAAIKKRPLLHPAQKRESVIKVSSIRHRSGHFCRDVAAAQRTILQTCALYSLLSGKYYTDFCTKVQEER